MKNNLIGVALLLTGILVLGGILLLFAYAAGLPDPRHVPPVLPAAPASATKWVA